MSAIVGFDRKIKREWLDAVTDYAAQGPEVPQLRTFLHELLQEVHPGKTARGKTITVLMRIWACIPGLPFIPRHGHRHWTIAEASGRVHTGTGATSSNRRMGRAIHGEASPPTNCPQHGGMGHAG